MIHPTLARLAHRLTSAALSAALYVGLLALACAAIGSPATLGLGMAALVLLACALALRWLSPRRIH
jgi:hypothetical protein